MKQKHKLIGVIFSTYIAAIAYPLLYLLSPLITVRQHQISMVIILVLLIPTYYALITRFKHKFLRKTIKYSVLTGSPIQRGFSFLLIFLGLGLSNALIITLVFDIEMVPFMYWNPIIETIISLILLFALLAQLALIEKIKEEVKEESFDTDLDI